MTVGTLSFKTGSALRMVSANLSGPGSAGGMLVTTGITTNRIGRQYFSIGSGDLTEIRLSYFSFYVNPGVGITASSAYTVNLASFEYNGISVPITFSGGRTLSVTSGASDLQSDPLYPVMFGLTKFTQGSFGYIRSSLTFAISAIASQNGSRGTGWRTYDYDPAKVTITNGVDSTGAITYTMTGGGVDGTDIKDNAFPMAPAVLGRFVQNDPPAWLIIGDSGCVIGDTGNSEGTLGLGRVLYLNPTTPAPTGAIAGWNIGSPSGIASDWQNGTPSLVNNYLKYFKYAIEEYGGNGFLPTSSQAIHTTLRSNGIKSIIRTSLTPRTNDPVNGNWSTDAAQTQQSGWGPGSGADTFEQTMKALVAADLTYIDYHTPLASLSNYWLWFTNGTPFFETVDGLHPSTFGYAGGKCGGTSNITKLSGTTTGTLTALVASYP